MVKKISNNGKIYDKLKKNILEPVKPIGKISEFFYHMLAYGGFNFKDGVMFVWVDPCFFIPISAFVILLHDLRNKIGYKNANQLFYWLGRLNGMAGMVVLINKFGFNPKDIPKLINSATQDGFGYLNLRRFGKKGNILQGEIEGVNSTFALKYKEIFGVQKYPVDYYLLGVLAGGSEILFKTPVLAIEKNCISKGEDKCIYYLESTKDNLVFDFFKNTSLDEKSLIYLTQKLAMSRKPSFKPFGKKEIRFGDGRFILRNYVGINISAYSLIILHKILSRKIPNDFYKILSSQADAYLDALFRGDLISYKALDDKFLNDVFSLFCFGKYSMQSISKDRIRIYNPNNPYPIDYKFIFGKSKVPVDDFLCELFRRLFEKFYPNKIVKVKEVSCVAKGDKTCIFDISLTSKLLHKS